MFHKNPIPKSKIVFLDNYDSQYWENICLALSGGDKIITNSALPNNIKNIIKNKGIVLCH